MEVFFFFFLVVLPQLSSQTPLATVVTGNDHYQQMGSTDKADAMFALATHWLHGKRGNIVACSRAKTYLERAVNAGSADAMNELGHLLHKGANGVPRDPLRAKSLYESAIDRGNQSAFTNLASLLTEGASNVPLDHTRAKQLYEHAINAGDACAMSNLAQLLETEGNGERRDFWRILQLYEDASSAGDIPATCRLAFILYQGAEGIPRDVPRAHELFTKFVRIGSLQYSFLLREFRSHDFRNIAYGRGLDKFLHQFVGAGNADNMYRLGDMLGHEYSDIPGSECLFELAEDAGRAGAASILGTLFERGTAFMPNNACWAKTLYERDAKIGNARALYKLGTLLRHGSDRVPKDVLGAKRLLEYAADVGHVEAMNALGVLLHDGDNAVPVDAPRAKQLFERAISGGSVKAMVNLGALLRDGAESVPRDIVRSKQLFAQAGQNGVASALVDLAELVLSEENGARIDVHWDDWSLLEQTLGAVRVKARSALEEIVDEGVWSVWARRKVALFLFLFISFSNFRITVMARIMVRWRQSTLQGQAHGILRNILYVPIETCRPSIRQEDFLMECRIVLLMLGAVTMIGTLVLVPVVSLRQSCAPLLLPLVLIVLQIPLKHLQEKLRQL